MMRHHPLLGVAALIAAAAMSSVSSAALSSQPLAPQPRPVPEPGVRRKLAPKERMACGERPLDAARAKRAEEKRARKNARRRAALDPS